MTGPERAALDAAETIVSSQQASSPCSEFELGISEIDLQHREINALLERLRQSTGMKYGYAVNTILSELDVQTRIHFAVEESLMRLFSFPDTLDHVAEHRSLSERLEKFRERAQDFDFSDGLSGFIQSWLIDHINNHDRLLVVHLLAARNLPIES